MTVNYSATFEFFDSFRVRLAKDINLETDSFVMLLTDDSYIPDLTSDIILADIWGEVSGGGYTRQSLTGVTFAQSGATAVFDHADVVFPATGGEWTARRFIIFDDTASGKPLVGVGLLRDDGSDITISDGNNLTFSTPPGGLFVQE